MGDQIDMAVADSVGDWLYNVIHFKKTDSVTEWITLCYTSNQT